MPVSLPHARVAAVMFAITTSMNARQRIGFEDEKEEEEEGRGGVGGASFDISVFLSCSVDPAAVSTLMEWQ